MFVEIKKLKKCFFVAVILALIFTTSCAKSPPEINPNLYASRSGGQFWIPDSYRKMENSLPPSALSDIPQDVKPYADNLNMSDFVDIALRNNPSTKVAWANAKAKAANWGEARGEYYPILDASASGGAQNVRLVTRGAMGSVGASLSYLLLDFGGRNARAESAKQALIAANWNHNQIIQDVLRNVPKQYYIHLSDKAQVKATERNLADARVTLDSTRYRRKAGVATIADVLQAESHEAQVRVNLIRDEGDVQISRGRLATAVGWPANAHFNVVGKLEGLPMAKIERNVDSLIDIARQNKPDLNSAVANLRQKEAELKQAKAISYPKFSASGEMELQRNMDGNNNSYFGGVLMKLPIFHGFAMENQIRKARADLEGARAALRNTEENVIQGVWIAYYNFRTAARQVDASKDFLRSSQEAYNVSLGRYKAGAAEITEVLDAQTVLAEARAQLVDAETNLYTSYADILHEIGSAIPSARAKEIAWPNAAIRETSYGE